MARKIVDIGSIGNDGTGDSIRDSFRKTNDNFKELYSSLGLGDKLTFIALDDTPQSFLGQEGAILAVNPTTDGVQFKQLTAGLGITVDDISNSNQIIISTEFSEISGDTSPQLGGNLSVQSGGNTYRIQGLDTPVTSDEAASKGYADTKISRAGTGTIDPATGNQNVAFGTMTGPLILSRSPEPEDDELYDGLIAATKQYVDGAAFGSSVNLYVATSGQDERVGVSEELQGRALAYAYKTIEAALKRAEEIVLESLDDIGPYKKQLTYNNGSGIVTLSQIDTSPDSGTGFAGTARMSVDKVTMNAPGANYQSGDIITLSGGTGTSATIKVLSTATSPGAITTFQLVAQGDYTALPGTVGVVTTSDSTFGLGATFDITYKVNGVDISAGGSGYSLVSVRVSAPLPAVGSFGNAVISGGIITSVDILDAGSNFTTVPTVEVDLPRFLLATGGYRTDYTGDVLTDTPVAFRTRDIREGLFLRGETSGALAQILAHSGALDSNGNEIFDVDIKYGTFLIDEAISYGDITNQVQISLFIESGIYQENYPLKVPQNVAIIGDEFRRVLIKPRPGTSSSPWSFQKFRRDPVVDGLTVATQLYGHHYLSDSTAPVYPKIDNAGGRTKAAALIKLNKSFIQSEVVEWINLQIATNTAPFTQSFTYNQALCKRDVGLVVDAMIFDIRYGGYNRTISAGLKYYQSASGRVAIGAQLSQTIAGLERAQTAIDYVLTNVALPGTITTALQIIDTSFIAETGSQGVVAELFDAIEDVMDGSGSVNYPKENDVLDVFLMNDANIIRAVTGQGHGGFMMVLDPEGQILAKSPYCQESASFSKSINKQTFAGGMFVDGFAGNLQFQHVSSTSNTRIEVTGLERLPQLPASFIVDDTVFRINYVRDFVYNKNGSSASFILDETTAFTRTAGAVATTISQASPATFTRVAHRLQEGAVVRFTTTGTLPSPLVVGQDYYVSGTNITTNTFQVSATPGGIDINTTTAGSGTHSHERIYEVLMPGNRSMLSNDFTQVADMGYGLLATNGGLTEAVSMFTYYCYASYMSINGAQIRSVGGSSAHGIYALVAEGSDPLEVPTPTTLYHDLAQAVTCYFPSAAYANVQAGLFLFVEGYDYTPLNNSELEVNHGNLIYRYPVTSVATADLPAGVVRLNLTSDTTGNFDGIFAVIPNGTKMSLRSNSQVMLTGELVNVATRPSTGLILQEYTDVYRVLQFESEADSRGNYEFTATATNPGVFTFKATITTTASSGNVATFSQNHGLVVGDTIVPDGSGGGLTGGTTYHIIDVPEYTSVVLSATAGGSAVTLSDATPNLKVVVPHKLLYNYRLSFSSSNTLPAGITAGETYWIREENLTATTFEISNIINGAGPVEITNTGTGTHSAIIEGLTRTTLRENYNYVDLTVYKPGEAKAATTQTFTVSVDSPAVITKSSHGFSQGDPITLNTTGALPTGLNTSNHYFVHTVLNPNTFTVSVGYPTLAGAVQVDTTGTQTGTHTYHVPTGAVGDSSFAVVAVAPQERSRVAGSTFVWNGEIYVIDTYEDETVTGNPWGRLTLDRPLVDSLTQFEATYSIKSAVRRGSLGARGKLTIRISLTRVTSHDLLEIGTGSYADTNYPTEIYGPPVNAFNPDTETDERTVGRVFYVTTDQFGNFNVGPYFRVDQGTGQVTFSAAIALSNLDGIGFKRGVPVSEFSTDSAFTDNAVDTVPTENATRLYMERRLGTSHSGAPITQANLIPSISGGFMALDGSLSMKSPMSLGNQKIIDIADPTQPTDGVNLRSLTFTNLQEFTVSDLKANDILVFTGNGNDAINSTIVGDIALDIDSTLGTIDAQIQPGVIVNNDINASAAIAQSKLTMADAQTRANATGITQAEKGIVALDNTYFTVTNGWVTITNSTIPKAKLTNVAAKSVIGNNTLAPATPADVTFTTIVDDGGAIKKTQYSSTGFLRRTSGSSNTADVDYGMIEATSNSTSSTLIQRDGNADASARIWNATSSFTVSGNTTMAHGTSGTASYTRLYTGSSGSGGLYLQTGSLASDKRNFYDNDYHRFRTQSGVSLAPIETSQVLTTSLTTGGNTTAGTITGRWSLTGTTPSESRFEATYAADLAEYYEGDKEYEVGTVLVFGGDKEVTTSNRYADTRVAGVVSDRAAYVMYTACPGLKNLVGLQGRIPVRVVGKINKGDLIVTAAIHGVGIAADGDVRAGTIIGKALETYDSDHIGTIEVAVGRT